MIKQQKPEAVTPETKLRMLIDRLDAKTQKIFRSVRAALRKRFPTANELAYDYSSFVVVGYSPNENGIDGILTIAGRATGVDLYFANGPKLPDPKKLLQGSASQTRFIKLESAAQLTDPDVEAFIAAAIGLAKVPFPASGEGSLIIKTFKMGAAKKRKASRNSAPAKTKRRASKK
jgi:hypothetical protein